MWRKLKIKESDEKRGEKRRTYFGAMRINTYRKATRKQVKQQASWLPREEIEKVRYNEDKESFYNKYCNFFGGEEKKCCVYIFGRLRLLFHFSRICNLLNRSTTVPASRELCVMTRKVTNNIFSTFSSSRRVPEECVLEMKSDGFLAVFGVGAGEKPKTPSILNKFPIISVVFAVPIQLCRGVLIHGPFKLNTFPLLLPPSSIRDHRKPAERHRSLSRAHLGSIGRQQIFDFPFELFVSPEWITEHCLHWWYVSHNSITRRVSSRRASERKRKSERLRPCEGNAHGRVSFKLFRARISSEKRAASLSRVHLETRLRSSSRAGQRKAN